MKLPFSRPLFLVSMITPSGVIININQRAADALSAYDKVIVALGCVKPRLLSIEEV